MEFLGIGPLELLIILLLALVLLGPKDMAKAGRSFGKTMRKVVTSPQWKLITQTSRELRNLPNRLMREAGLDEIQKDIDGLQKTTAEIQESLRSSSILPPNWLDPDQGTSTSKNNPGSLSGVDPNSSGGMDQQSSEAIPNQQETQLTQASTNLSAWTTPGQPESERSAPDRTDLSAWITPPNQRKNKPTKKQP